VIDAGPRVRYSIPAPPSADQLVAQSRAAWQPAGRSIGVAGRTIPGGLVYVGSMLDSVSGHRGTDPALIAPKLAVARSNADTSGRYLSYWPSYSDLPPESRAAYLDWLAAGRPAGAPIGYVFLFFYGLERRVLFDARHDPAARAEIPSILQEVDRLKRLYPNERSFQGYASEFLVAGLLMKGRIDPREIEPPMPDGSWELPLAAKVALGTFAARRQSIPPIWALSWLRCDPETRLRTPAKRCGQEFTTLFRIAYQHQFGEGMILDPPKRTLELAYRPASAGFGGTVALEGGPLPDVSQLRKPQYLLREIADRATDQLDDYSRALGNGRPGSSASALAYLPDQLGDIARFPSVAPLASRLAIAIQGQDASSIEVAGLLQHFPELGARPSQKQSAAISRLVERLGYGLEPDPATRRKAFVDSSRVGLYRLDSDNTLPSRNLDGAIGLLGICSLVARADGAMTAGEERVIFEQIERAYSLSVLEARKMRANLLWLGFHPATLNDARKPLALLSPGQAQQTGRFLVTIAGIDGHIAPDEVRVLTRLYQTMGLNDQQLHSDLHNLTTRTSPARVFDATPATSNAVTAPPATRSTGEIGLDAAYVRLVQKQTAEIAGVLDAVFAEEVDAVQIADADSFPAENETEADPSDPYRELIEHLSERPTWEMTEISAMARSLGLMASGAIETLNDRATALGLVPLLDCDAETCDVDATTLEAVLARA
jgi:tellurite resistance protein